MTETEAHMSALTGVESYLEHYQLSHDPFAARTPGFKFFTPKRKEVLAELHHLARYASNLLVITGPQGSGKTLLRQALVASCNKDTVQCVVMSARELSGEAQVLASLCQAAEAGSQDIQALLARAEQLHQVGIQLYLVVDDAEKLDQQALQLLADLSQVAGKAAPRVFLFAEPAFEAALARLDTDGEPDWVRRIELQPYELDDTRDYLAQRLESAGQGIELLDDRQVLWIHEHSGGWPGAINQAGRQAMMAAMGDELEVPRAARKGPVLPLRSLVALVLVGLGVMFAWFMGDRPQEPSRTVLQLPDPVVEVEARPTPTPPPALIPSVEIDPVAEPSAPPSAPAPVVAEAEVAPVAEPVAEPEPIAEPTPVVPPPVATAPAPAPVPPSEAAVGGAHTAAWYRQRQGSEYVLQLLGTRSRQAALDFVAAQRGVSDLGYFETRHEGQPWFVVTQGVYPGRQQAQQAVNGLPESVRRQNPWPRSIASIQQSLQ
ncbi:cell division protein [Pseudomonas sp. WN033]|nr:cell division protein [Pseudomonas sp. WN033]